MTLTAIIADDEPLLRQALIAELALIMPQLDVIAEFTNGPSALAWLQQNTVDIAFLDIRMPGLTGLDVARSILNAWPAAQTVERAAPLIVFVTAFEEYAAQAFDTEALDYLLKPVTTARLQQTLVRINARLAQRTNLQRQQLLETKLKQALSQLSYHETPDRELRSIRASVGDEIRLIPIQDVIYFQAEDKYVSVYTEAQHALIREPLKALLPRLPADRFAKIHRSTIVNLSYVQIAERLSNGTRKLQLRGTTFQPIVSRSCSHLFKAM